MTPPEMMWASEVTSPQPNGNREDQLCDPGSGIGEEMCQQMSVAQDGHAPCIAASCGGSLDANETTHLSRLGDYVHLKMKMASVEESLEEKPSTRTLSCQGQRVLTSSRRE